MTYDVVVVGNAGIDTNIYLPGEDIDFSHEANFTQDIDYVGQAGAYASRGYASLGLRTAFIGSYGEDVLGQWVRQTFFKQGIGTEGMFIDPAGTSRSVNIMYQDGRRKNFYDGRGHMSLHPPLTIAKLILSQARMVHFNIPNWARELLPLTRNAGAVIACDIQDVVDPDDPYRQDFILSSDYLFFSAANHGEPEPIMRHFWHKNPRVEIVAGMGAEGCAVGSGGIIRRFPAVDLDLPIIDTNGAGDALAVGYLTARVFNGLPVEDAVLRGQIGARHTCAQKATTDTLITPALLERYLKKVS
jgi:sugar/nucleoside kinase (ribokinase family)